MQNGRLTSKELAPIFHPKHQLFLASDGAAASWNTMRRFLLKSFGPSGDIYPEGDGTIGAYRTFDEQVKAKALYGKNAATPGHSNHGLGHAVDLATPRMEQLIDRYGGSFGWHHWDATWEHWHREYDGGFERPDPGIDQKNPVLRKGSGGPGQAEPVRLVQRRLNLHAHAGFDVNGEFGTDTHAAVVAFQRAHGLTANAVVDTATWAKLRAAPAGKIPLPKATQPRKGAPSPAPSTKPLRGFDVLDTQGDVDFTKAHAGGMAFASVRVADGDYRDVRYGPGRVNALRESGLAWFPYHYARVAGPHNGERNGSAEAAMAITLARNGGWGKKGDLPLAYRFEHPNGQSPSKCARHLVQFVQAYRDNRGHYPILYTLPSFWNKILPEFNAANRTLIARCPLWVASWSVPSAPALDPWGDAWMLWQNANEGNVPGVSTKCATDAFRRSADDFGELIVS